MGADARHGRIAGAAAPLDAADAGSSGVAPPRKLSPTTVHYEEIERQYPDEWVLVEVVKSHNDYRACPGGCEERQVTHTVRHRGQLVVFDRVPAEVCSVCGDVLLKPETIRRIEATLASGRKPAATAPVYEYPG